MNLLKREELNGLMELIKPLRYVTTREVGSIPDMQIWSITYVK